MIPWAALLRHAPTIVAAADTLLTRARAGRTEGAPQSLDERLARLEQGSRESAQLLHDIARQINALTLAQERTAQRARVALGLAVAAAVAAAGAWAFVLFS